MPRRGPPNLLSSPPTPLMARTNDFLSSSAHIFGIAQLSSVVSVPDKPWTVILEAGFWNGENPVLGIFRYHNGSTPPINFQPGESYFIHSTVSFSLASSVSSTHYVARLPCSSMKPAQNPRPLPSMWTTSLTLWEISFL